MNGSMVVLSTFWIAPNTTIAAAPADLGTNAPRGSLIVDSHVGSWSEYSRYAWKSRAADSPIAPLSAAITLSLSKCCLTLTMLLARSSERGDTYACVGLSGL